MSTTPHAGVASDESKAAESGFSGINSDSKIPEREHSDVALDAAATVPEQPECTTAAALSANATVPSISMPQDVDTVSEAASNCGGERKAMPQLDRMRQISKNHGHGGEKAPYVAAQWYADAALEITSPIPVTTPAPPHSAAFQEQITCLGSKTSQPLLQMQARSTVTTRLPDPSLQHADNRNQAAPIVADGSVLVERDGDHELGVNSDQDVSFPPANSLSVEGYHAQPFQIAAVDFQPSLLMHREPIAKVEGPEMTCPADAVDVHTSTPASSPLHRLEIQWTDPSLGTISLTAEIRGGELHAAVNSSRVGSSLDAHEIRQFLHEERVAVHGLQVNGMPAIPTALDGAGGQRHVPDDSRSSQDASQSFTRQGHEQDNSRPPERETRRERNVSGKTKLYLAGRQQQIDSRLSIHI